MKSLAALYPSQYRDYVKQWKRQYAENPEVFHETGFLRLAQYARKVGGSSKADVGVSLQRVISRGITFGSLPVIRKYIHGERGAVVLQNALLKCAELRLKKQPACLSDVLQTYFSQE